MKVKAKRISAIMFIIIAAVIIVLLLCLKTPEKYIYIILMFAALIVGLRALIFRPEKQEPSTLLPIATEAVKRGRRVMVETKEGERISISPAIDGITELMPEETPVKEHIEEGDRFFHEDKFKESAASYDKARKTATGLKEEKASALAFLGLGAALCRQRKYKQAIPILTECTKHLEEEALARTYFNRGVAYYELEDYKEAISDWDKAIEINPQFAEAYYNRGNAYDELKDYEKAIEDCTKAIEINPQYAKAYYNRGVTYGRDLKQPKKAIADYDKAVEINPQFAEAYYNRGVTHDELEEYKKAIEDYDKALEINPQYAKAYYNRGVAYGKLGRTDKAIEDYNKAIEINPQYAMAYYNLACVYALRGQEGDKERMIKYLKKAIELDDEYKKMAKEDDDFKDYWDQPEFKKLVE